MHPVADEKDADEKDTEKDDKFMNKLILQELDYYRIFLQFFSIKGSLNSHIPK